MSTVLLKKTFRLAPGSYLLAILLAGGCGKDQAADGPADSATETAAADSQQTRVTLTPEQITSSRIGYAVVERRAGAGVLEATAQIEPAGNRFAQIGSRVSGRISALRASEGDRVAAGQVLASIESPEMGEAKAQFITAFATAKVTRDIANRERTLFERKISAEREWRQAEADAVRAEAEKQAAESQLHSLGLDDSDLLALPNEVHYTSSVSVRSPIAGVIARRSASLGQVVEPAEALFEVVDLREVWLVIDVYEQSFSQLRLGQKVEVRTGATGDRVFTGTVASIGAVVEPQTRTVKVRVVLPNADGALRPGMFANARIQGTITGADERGLFVPATAVQRDGEETVVFVPAGTGAFARRVIRTGEPAGDLIQVLEGLAEGDSVVTDGSFLLKSEFRKGELGEEE